MKFKTTSSLAALGLLMSASAMAQMNHNMPMGHSMPAGQAAATAVAAADAAAMGEGQVKSVNKARGTVTLAHGALPNGMPPMTMAYKVKDKAWLDQLQAGQKIRFATDPKDGGMTVLHYELVK
ncbi:copper-binding protein [Rhodoferax sp.]|uniref:copper-binding protein n=1 Tax=Rhodoferax sp. TaxID=50421 RepID=UPI0019FEE970|nr:copper-binding protein [Rhodoferax sp.]MBE0474136.1 copper-binding protein [Rhodoferax sp.]